MAKVLPTLLTLVICHISAQNAAEPADNTPPAAVPPNATQEFLEAHNQARAAVGVVPLKWSQKLANATSLLVRYQRDKKSCQFADLSTSKYGGNQLIASGQPVAPREVVDFWVAEKKYYDYANNSCAPEQQCGVYTQVVWSKSLELGCAQAKCVKDSASLTVCFYEPPGNIIGEKPY
ncbi:STS14 protein [Cornus florida]|uniref:STS14 protein n=1 Tax=Cornus florida TaxID=4283 RepID=UPI002897CEA4|nr:STS14 protein [Cornus florida]